VVVAAAAISPARTGTKTGTPFHLC